MRRGISVVGFLGVLLPASLISPARTEADDKPAPPPAADPPPAGQPLNDLEKKFAETLTDALMVGRWRLVHDGKLGEEKEERYTISSAAKVAGDFWVIRARIQYGGKDVTVPVPVKVLWAGDTPMISITNLPIPGLGTYTARVTIYQGLYSGTWFGPGHGGFLNGTIQKAAAQKPVEGAGTAPPGAKQNGPNPNGANSNGTEKSSR